MEPLWAEKGDTFFTRSDTLLGKLIRWGEEHEGDPSAWTNHTGVVVESGWIGVDADAAIVVEALWKTRKGPLKLNGTAVRVFRPVPPYNPMEVVAFQAEANGFVGDKYGWWKLIGFLAKKVTKINFPELFFVKSRPICSFLSAWTNQKARPKNSQVGNLTWQGFGMDPQAADPDSMMDFCLRHPALWQEVK